MKTWKKHRSAFVRILLIIGGLLLVWRIAALGTSQYYIREVGQNRRSLDMSLAWNSRNPEALSLAGQLLVEEDPKRAELLLRQAFTANPSDSHALVALAKLWLKQGEPERADQAVEMAEQLSPADVAANLQAASYWLLRDNVERALLDWNRALLARSGLSKQLFPVLLRIAEQPPYGQSAFSKIVRQRPPWWQDFFIYATREARQVKTLRTLYDLYQNTNRPLTTKERNAYITRLQNEKLWGEAYMVWLNSLIPDQMAVLGQIYDGGFEQTRFEQGFDWHIATRKGLEVDAHSLFGGRKGKALQITFHGEPIRGIIAEQPLFLFPGRYRLSGQVKTDSIQTANGLVWSISCADGEKAVLAETERFVGTNQWRSFSTPFSVPAGRCAGQRLSLHAKGTAPQDFRIRGEAWFDDLAITWLSAVSGTGSRASLIER
jgi:tetratricopeptide (TPR) repeat protein